MKLQEWQSLVIEGTIKAILDQGQLPTGSCEVQGEKVLLSAPAMLVGVCKSKLSSTSALALFRRRVSAAPDNVGLVFHEARACTVPSGKDENEKILTEPMVNALMECNDSLQPENRVAGVIDFLVELKRTLLLLQTV